MPRIECRIRRLRQRCCSLENDSLSEIRSRALVLTAGIGSRLRPLTLELPKALLPVLGKTLISRTLSCLKQAGCEAAVLNLHHLGEQIPASLGDQYDEMPLHFSREPSLLGTLGGIAAVKDFLSDCDVALVINGDSLCEWPIGELIGRHLESGASATLLVTSRADPEAFGGVGVLDGFLASLPPEAVPDGAASRVFAGAHAWQPELVRSVVSGRPDLIPHLYRPLLDSRVPMAVHETDRPWHDLGTPARYLVAVLAWSGGSGWSSSSAAISDSAKVEHSVIEDSCRIGAGAVVRESLLMPGSQVGEGAEVVGTIVGPGAKIVPGTQVENLLLTRQPGEASGRPVRTSLETE